MGVKQIVEKPSAPSKVSPYDEEIRELLEKRKTRIKVVGAGGAGNNTITRLMQVGIVGAETIAVNTDAQDLLYTDADIKVLIGRELTGGLGAGADPRVGMEAAKESKEDIKKALRGADMVFLTCGLGGGCLRGDSLILTNPEGPIPINSIKPGGTVYTINERGELEKREVLAVMKTGVKRVLEVKTKNRTLYASFDHPFLRVRKLNNLNKQRFSKFALEWVEAQHLKPGDLVVILREVPDEGNPFKLPDGKRTTKEFCRLFGFLLGDGWISRSKKSWKVFFSPSLNKERNEFYKTLLEKMFGIKVKKSKNWFYANSKKAYEILESLGLKKRAKDKEIPSWIFSLPKTQKITFILGLADADGSFNKSLNKNGKEKIELRFEMGSEKLIRQLKVLCDSIGLRTGNVLFRKRNLKPPNSKGEKLFKSWSLRIYRLDKLDKKMDRKKRKNWYGVLIWLQRTYKLKFFQAFWVCKNSINKR